MLWWFAQERSRDLSSSRGTVCAGLIREIPLAIQRNEGDGARNAGSKQESIM